MSHRFDDPRFTYGNWNAPHLYYCVRCEDRTQAYYAFLAPTA